jgi:hypothetical protein
MQAAFPGVGKIAYEGPKSRILCRSSTTMRPK